MEQYGWLSLLPPLVAIVLAFVTRRVLVSLAAGVLCGAMILAVGESASDGGAEGWGSRALWLLPDSMGVFMNAIWNSVSDHSHLMVFAFTMLLGAMVGVLEITGAMRASMLRLAGRVSDSRGGQTIIAVMGLVVFFDDYANTLLVGGTMQSTADRYGISRAKLAYLVDSTAAPVAGLAIVSTWVATELSYLEAGIAASDLAGSINAFEFFVQSVAYRFYPWLAIGLVFIIALTGRDFGPMRREELAALEKMRDSQNDSQGDLGNSSEEERAGGRDNGGGVDRWSGGGVQVFAIAFAPILVCLLVLIGVLVTTGWSEVGAENLRSLSESVDGSGWTFWGLVYDAGNLLGSGDSYWALVAGGGAGLVVALMLADWGTAARRVRVFQGVFNGLQQMLPAMGVLWLAWALSGMTEQLDTGGFLSSVLTDRLDVRWLPTCVFLLGGVIAFSTGTSWGTMAILTPIAVSLVLDMQVSQEGLAAAGEATPIALATFGSVLAGAIFGDHCSPISDTTVLSSRACGCDHVTHVSTQMPYAMLAAAVCVVAGTVPVGFGVPVGVCFLAGMVGLVISVRLLGRRPSAGAEEF
ncbi:Na+/H+ antiporter NhaC family protein [Neorhodopirellula lusitana]|uniref:Na+/H+ antiporter NhaC family protein n=1 Tax=Neorhodopirellula lusitana TaxID=445327 RepID=UPI00384DD53C